MTKKFLLLLLALPGSGCLQAQLNLLTLRESVSIVERIPDVIAAQKKGECPNFEPAYDTPEDLAFQVRSTCGSYSGAQLGHYTVNRFTGEVVLWGDNPEAVSDAEGRAFAKRLVAQARQRILSADEARCLALEAARGLPGWAETDALVSVKPFGKANKIDGTKSFVASRSSSVRATESGRMLTVNLATAMVRDDETGLSMMSRALGAVISKVLELRAPPSLTDEDAIAIALLVPSFGTQLQHDCTVYGGGAFRSDQALVAVSCKGNTVAGASVSVNLKTGAVLDLRTGRPVAASEVARAARERLEQIQNRKVELQIEVEAVCRPK